MKVLPMKIFRDAVHLKTRAFLQFVDLTDKIAASLTKSKIKNGFVTIFTKHTTAAVRVNEKEKGIINDFKKMAEKIAPKKAYWEHNDLRKRTENLVCSPGASDCQNAHSHLLQLLMGTSETIPVVEGKLSLGPWQRIFLIELDCPRDREVIVQVIGE